MKATHHEPSPIDAKTLALDRELQRLGKDIEILERINWPLVVRERFLEAWHKSLPALPSMKYRKANVAKPKLELLRLEKSCDLGHPIQAMIAETAESFRKALMMLEQIGKKSFQDLSAEIYGVPKGRIPGTSATSLNAAKHLLKALKVFREEQLVPKEDICLLPDFVAEKVQARAKKIFKGVNISVELSSTLTSKASAGTSRVRIRKGTCFANHDLEQIIQHELLVHTLTLQNGKLQGLNLFGMSSPRITRSQEGLAVFAEFISGAMDVTRLLRIAARVEAIQMGMDGADFIDVFRFFLEHGQDEQESFHSAARIFRGGKPSGGVIFTKDLTYMSGFVEVHRFLLDSLQQEKYLYPQFLFAGRMATSDVPRLAEFFEHGILHMPQFLPEWARNRSTLVAFLLSALLMNKLGLAELPAPRERKPGGKKLKRKA